METKKYSIGSLNVSNDELQHIISDIIDSQINSFGQRSISEWENDHSKKTSSWKDRIARLSELKKKLNFELMKQMDEGDLFDVKFSIELISKKKNTTSLEFERIG
ncbi:MAG: hypothetical protein EP338_05945 [Bacteroidetes bacterium]|nr:MAG: hypothetical protein EP338_05945 [Bacteroidota bacterium]